MTNLLLFDNNCFVELVSGHNQTYMLKPQGPIQSALKKIHIMVSSRGFKICKILYGDIYTFLRKTKVSPKNYKKLVNFSNQSTLEN